MRRDMPFSPKTVAAAICQSEDVMMLAPFHYVFAPGRRRLTRLFCEPVYFRPLSSSLLSFFFMRVATRHANRRRCHDTGTTPPSFFRFHRWEGIWRRLPTRQIDA